MVKKTAAEIKAEKEANPKGKRAAAARTHYECPNQLKKLREDAKLSFGDVASGSGVGAQTISSAEDGSDISLSRALALAAFWEMTVEEIWDGEVVEKETDDSPESPGQAA